MQANKPYITTKLSNHLDEILFQIGALHTYSMIHNKTMCISDPDEFTEATKLFQYVPYVPYVPDDYYILSDADEQVFKIVPYAKNIILQGIFKSFKMYTEDTLSFLRSFGEMNVANVCGGIGSSEARNLIVRFGLINHWTRRVDTLSSGNQL